MPIGENLSVELAGVVSAVFGSKDELEELEPGVEEPLGEGAERRCTAGLRGLSFGTREETEVGLEGSSSSSADSSSSRPLGYSAHEVCTWYKLIGVRFSRLAARASKQ